MANLLDYLDWRSDLTLSQAPFNEVDNLILAELSFLNFKEIVPSVGEGSGISLRQAAERFFANVPAGEKIDMGVLVPAQIPDMLRKMAISRRFGDMKLSCFTEHLDVGRGEQFAALTIDTGENLYLSFRGTDDTLAGWKEDFHLACMPEVPAQKKALEYVRTVAKQYPRRRLQLGGHSKGGNLAVYGAVFSPESIQRRIATVWSNDGPGFHMDLLDLPEYRRLAERVVSIVPKSSVVGMLLEHTGNYAVVDSNQMGLLQHDGFSWQVMGDHFIHLRRMTPQAHLNNQEMRAWIHQLPVEQRERFVEAMFNVLSASGATTLTDLKEDKFKAAVAMVKAMKDMDKETRDGLLKFTGLLFKSNFLLILEGIHEEAEKVTAGIKQKKKEK